MLVLELQKKWVFVYLLYVCVCICMKSIDSYIHLCDSFIKPDFLIFSDVSVLSHVIFIFSALYNMVYIDLKICSNDFFYFLLFLCRMILYFVSLYWRLILIRKVNCIVVCWKCMCLSFFFYNFTICMSVRGT